MQILFKNFYECQIFMYECVQLRKSVYIAAYLYKDHILKMHKFLNVLIFSKIEECNSALILHYFWCYV